MIYVTWDPPRRNVPRSRAPSTGWLHSAASTRLSPIGTTTVVAMADGARRGRPRLTDEQRAEQRSRLLAASMDAIRKHGSDVSIDDIASEAGVSKPVIYGHFGDRLGLADAIAVVTAEGITEATVAEVAERSEGNPGDDFESAVGVIVSSLVDLVENESEIYGFLVRTIRSGDRGFFDNALVDVIRERGGQLAEIANPDVSEEARKVLVDGAFGFLLFAIESWHQAGSPPRAELTATLTEAVVAGFGVAAGRGALTVD